MYPSQGSGLRITMKYEGDGTDEPSPELTCLDPSSTLAYLDEHGIPHEHVLGVANSFVLPRGREYGRGHVLMLWKDVKQLFNPDEKGRPKSFNHTLKFQDAYGEVEINKLCILRVRAITGISANRPDNSCVMLDLADCRYIGRFTTVNKAYNYRSFRGTKELGGADWYDTTLNGAVPWTWAEVLDNLWDMLPSCFGTLFDAGSYPTKPPENLIFRGLSAWDAICSVLDACNHTIYRTLVGGFVIVSKADAQAVGVETATHRKAVWSPTNDQGLGVLFPETIRVYFPADRNAFQNDADEASVAGQDAYRLNPLYSKDVTTVSVDGFDDVQVFEGGIVSIHATKLARYNEAGTLINGVELTTHAEELAESWLASQDYDSYSLHTIYHGFHEDLSAGSKTAAVAWYSTGHGSKTEVLLSPLHYDPKDAVGTLGKTHAHELSTEFNQPPDLARVHEQTERFLVVRLEEEIECKDGYGDAVIQYGVPYGLPIGWGGAGKTITVHNPSSTTYFENSMVLVFYHWQAKRFIIVGPGTMPEYRTTLTARMCPGENATFEGAYNTLCCSDLIEDTTAGNPYKLSGMIGDSILLGYDCMEGGLVVKQIEHKETEVVLYPFGSEEGCIPELDEYGNPTGNNVATGECKITYTKRSISAMYCQVETASYVLYSFTAVDVLTLVYAWENDIWGVYTPIFVACPCDTYDELLIEGTTCDYGS